MGPANEEIVGVVVILLFCGLALYRAGTETRRGENPL